MTTVRAIPAVQITKVGWPSWSARRYRALPLVRPGSARLA